MKIYRLATNPDKYSSNAYLLLGEWNKLTDINTIIDTGADGFIIDHIEKINKGVGKKSIDKIIITHNHFDHNGGLAELKKKYDPKIYAFIPGPFVDELLKDNQNILIGDQYFQVLHTPGHSFDSVSLYCKALGLLFSGDLNIRVAQRDFTYTIEYIESIRKLASMKINTVYPGHGAPITDNPESILKTTFLNINSTGMQEVRL